MKCSIFGIAALGITLSACGGATRPVSPTPDPEVESLVEAQAEKASPGSSLVGDQLHRGVAYEPGESQEFRETLAAEQCYVVAAAGDEGIRAIQITIWGPDEKRLAGDKSRTREALTQLCTKGQGSYRFEAKVLKGMGHYAIGVYGR